MGSARRRLARISRGSQTPGGGPARSAARLRAGLRRTADVLAAHPRTLAVATSGLAGTAGALGAGPVAAVIAAAYAGLGALAWQRRRTRRRQDQARSAVVEAVAVLAADLRAGLAPSAVAEELRVVAGNSRVAAACLISEQLGAPLADLLERVDVDLRAGARLRASVQAQTAGTRATAWLLAALPLAGIGLGVSLGVDPAHSMLHTPIGAACVLGALLLQLAGLAWSSRLVSGASRAVG
ncbi:MAG TPA: hypothetical protein VK453_03065 [Micromonosporaceae bacterium]|nr:hypothetical protein [Micromonosporaceae bacterium]